MVPTSRAIYEQASVKCPAGRFRDRSNHLSGVAARTRHLTKVRVGLIHRSASPLGGPWHGRSPTFDPAFFLTTASFRWLPSRPHPALPRPRRRCLLAEG